MTTSHQQQSTQQQSQTGPWAPAQPGLQSILSQLSQINPAVNPTQNAALNQIQQNAQGLPNFGGAATGLAQNLTSNLPNFNQNLQGNFQNLQSTLSPYTNPNYLNPATNPAESQLINTITQDVGNNVNGMFAGAGRSLSGDNTQALARGLSQGLAAPLFNQYNQNVNAQQGAASNLYNAGNATQNNILSNASGGLNGAQSIPGLSNMSPLASLQASNMAYSLPLSQLGGIEGMTLPIAGLGSQSSGSSQGNSSFTPSPFQDAMQVAGLFSGGGNSSYNGILGGLQGFGNALGSFAVPSFNLGR